MQNACIALAAMVLLSACDEKEICFPQKPAQAAVSAHPVPYRRPSPQPRYVTLVVDRSWGMAGFIRRRADTPAQPPAGEFHSVVTALAARLPNLSAVQLPDETSGAAEPRTVPIATMAEERSFVCDSAHGCPGFSARAYIYRFLQRARGQGPTVGDSLKLSAGMDNVVVLLTDLQPDVEKGELPGSRMGLIQQELKTVVATLGLAVGIIPVPARFYGTIWDTEATSDPVLSTGNQRQPFFFVPIGREEQVRWTLDQLKAAIKEATGQPALKDYVFRRTPDQPDAVRFELTVPKPGKPEDAAAELTAPPPSEDDFSKTLNGAYVALKRSSVLQHPTQLAVRSSAPGFDVRISQTANPRIWRYDGGSYTANVCQQRWRDVSDSAAALAVTPIDDVGVLNAPLGQDQVQGLWVGATYYVEEPITYQLSPKADPPPDWVQKWNAEPKQSWKEGQTRDGNIAFGVNSLRRLFDDTRAAESSEPKQAMLRYAVEIRK